MKKYTLKRLILVFLTIVTIVIMTPNVAMADTTVSSLLCILQPSACTVGSFVASNFVMGMVADISYLILQISSQFLSLTGVLLNLSIILTMNIKAIYEATPAIRDVWVVLRNLSSIFIIFVLLYTSILTILDLGKTSIKDLVGKVIMVGLMINFSLFFTKAAIDASNLVSLQFYRAIVPNSAVLLDKSQIGSAVTGAFSSGGISDVFMSSLKITRIYDKKTNTGLLTDSNGGRDFKIAVSSLLGSILMIVAGLSFLAASIMFTVRLAILLLLIGFSPVYCAGMIFPEIEKDVSGKWMGHLRQQLLGMPVYLLFMYVSLRFISTINSSGASEGFFASLNYTQSTATASNGILISSVAIIIQYTIAFIFINIPIIAAVSTGGISAKWGESAKKWAGGFMAKHTLGRAASNIDKKLANTRFGNLQPIRDLRALTTQTMAASKFGGYSSWKDNEKESKERKKKGREIDTVIALDKAIKNKDHQAIKKTLDSMSSSEIASLDAKKYLTNEYVVPHLESSVYSSVDKGDKSEKDKVAILEARHKRLTEVVKSGNGSGVRNILKNMKGEDLQKYIESLPSAAHISDLLIEHIKPSHLKDMENLEDLVRKDIGDRIANWSATHTGNHPAEDHISKNAKLWGQ